MSSIKTILVVDDNIVNRKILSKILSEKYAVVEAENGRTALDTLYKHGEEISAVLLDIAMPVMDGYAFLEAVKRSDMHNKLPIIVTTESGNCENERKALSLGAWDFVSKPYDAEIILFRLKNSIDRSQLSALKQLKYLAEYDALTGIYNKAKFFAVTREMLDANPDEKFAFLRFDVDRFQLINSFFGEAEGDKLLIYIAHRMAEDAIKCEKSTYGRIGADIVGLCIPYEKSKVESMALKSKQTLAEYNKNYDIVPSIGIYVIDDNKIEVEEMYNRASLASKACKGNYVDFYAYYNESMSKAIAEEQAITNEMNFALESGQFEMYLQPQYNVHTNLPCGAEALVRWNHPQKGLLPPSVFIPLFERNGFITKLDFFVWEEACKFIRYRIDNDIKPYPISVNVSRVNIYNPNLVESIVDLVAKYGIDPELLHLELTESAYTDNPTAMKKAMTRLQSHGFVIMMDDFGSGYSSLSLLKDIAIDILKIDMQFLAKADNPSRARSIIASVIRMTKWLDIPMIAEGAETAEQVDFLRSVGCDFVQGYFFAKPMPIAEYDKLCKNLSFESQNLIDNNFVKYNYEDLFSSNPIFNEIFGNSLQPVAIYEFDNSKIEITRVNEAYYTLIGHDDMSISAPAIFKFMDEEHRKSLLSAFRSCTSLQRTVECEYMRRRKDGKPIWIHNKLNYISTVAGKKILIGELADITSRKELDYELQKYRESILSINQRESVILIVDDAKVNRAILKNILRGKFAFLEAENGEEAIKVMKGSRVDLILLDISMPIMDGKEFLKYKRANPSFVSVPVIMITADDSVQQQVSAFSLGANDYIVKPFIPEVVVRRVSNVVESNLRYKDLVKEYNMMSEQVRTDLMTGLVNRIIVEGLITQELSIAESVSAMLMLDVDNFKNINDTLGHDYGDKVICAVADKLRSHFRKEDIVARMGGDEFAVFIRNIDNMTEESEKDFLRLRSMGDIIIDGQKTDITCSVGVAFSSKEANTFATLYKNADRALYKAKRAGKSKKTL